MLQGCAWLRARSWTRAQSERLRPEHVLLYVEPACSNVNHTKLVCYRMIRGLLGSTRVACALPCRATADSRQQTAAVGSDTKIGQESRQALVVYVCIGLSGTLLCLIHVALSPVFEKHGREPNFVMHESRASRHVQPAARARTVHIQPAHNSQYSSTCRSYIVIVP